MKHKITRRRFLEAGGGGALASAVIPGKNRPLRAGENDQLTSKKSPEFEAYTNGVPVYSLGNIVFFYGVSPDVLPDVVMQDGNTNPKIKIKPKKSLQIKQNPFGATMPEPGPQTMWNDCEPMLPIHLIDGDPTPFGAATEVRFPTLGRNGFELICLKKPRSLRLC